VSALISALECPSLAISQQQVPHRLEHGQLLEQFLNLVGRMQAFLGWKIEDSEAVERASLFELRLGGRASLFREASAL